MAQKPIEGLVYSTDGGKCCPKCNVPIAKCQCAQKEREKPKGAGDVKVRRETKGRGGKTVSTISGVPLGSPLIEKLAKELKQRCGAGGSVKDGVIEIQGDHVDSLLEELKRRGYQAKRSGG